MSSSPRSTVTTLDHLEVTVHRGWPAFVRINDRDRDVRYVTVEPKEIPGLIAALQAALIPDEHGNECSDEQSFGYMPG